ncbi:LLM class oxidoreductase [Massilia sp. CFBP9026]|uniref:LLM class oxidoreductase n=1 Tax=Massilia sp. CFBP9026 TaxID=3096536 RepID=UPI002A69B813|nr:LLM class oxidoreductase [Massilia sp. CFBP9026]MDY0960680.1 LLM class oxidoreductase [Massilia sp. CFBP9026]
MTSFASHRGHAAMFRQDLLTLGLFFPIEAYSGAVPEMDVATQLATARLAEEKGFSALYFRDVPLNVPSFGDVGHIYDPWVFMGLVLGQTSRIALATGSIVSTLRHPLHLAKAAASIDRLSGQRLVLGLATGDRPSEFSAFRVPVDEKGERFREALAVLRRLWAEDDPTIATPRLDMREGDLLPKPLLRDIPVMVTGNSRQSLQWIAEHADGWLFYPQNLAQQAGLVRQWRAATPTFKPFAQSLYIDLAEDANEAPSPIFLGLRTGHRFLVGYLEQLRAIGVNHVGLNLKYGRRPAHEVVQELGEFVAPHFPALAGTGS